MRKKRWIQKLDRLFFFGDVRLTTRVSLSMKWYVREQGVMDFQ